MFSFEDFKALTGITDCDEVMRAVAQIPEEDLRPALTMTLLATNKYIEIHQELWKREYDRANQAEALLNARLTDN